MTKKNALGRGLSALIEEAKTITVAATTNEIDIDLIEVNPFQPRKTIDETTLNELAESIQKLGIIQPITVRKIEDDRYQIISGERRWRASRISGLHKIPAYIRDADDQGLLEMALVENIQREDLNPIEIAISYQRLLEECNITHESLSERVGKSRSAISNFTRLLKLPAEIQIGIRDKAISMAHARTLVNIDNAKNQLKLYNRIIKEGLSVRKVEELVRLMSEELPKQKRKITNQENDDQIKFQSVLSEQFKTKVEFKRSDNGKGRIVIPFKSDDELMRIKELLYKIQVND